MYTASVDIVEKLVKRLVELCSPFSILSISPLFQSSAAIAGKMSTCEH